MASPKPSIIIVPGAWHSPSHFAPTINLLESAGYTVHPVTLPSVGASPALDDWNPDIAAIRSVIETAIGPSGNSVVVMMHSYGGLPTSDAVHGLDATTRRAAGQRGGVVRLVYLAAFIVQQGQSLAELVGKRPDWQIFDEETKSIIPLNPRQIFYHDVSAPLAAIAVSCLRPHSLATRGCKLAHPAPWKRIPTTYIICEDDRTMPPARQEAMVAAVRRDPDSKLDTVERVRASHSPFLSMPEWTAAAVRRACGEKEGSDGGPNM